MPAQIVNFLSRPRSRECLDWQRLGVIENYMRFRFSRVILPHALAETHTCVALHHSWFSRKCTHVTEDSLPTPVQQISSIKPPFGNLKDYSIVMSVVNHFSQIIVNTELEFSCYLSYLCDWGQSDVTWTCFLLREYV